MKKNQKPMPPRKKPLRSAPLSPGVGGLARSAELRRTAAMPPGKPLQRGAKLNAQNRRRREAERLRAYGPASRRAFVQALPCAVCGRTPSENAHVGGLAGGAGMGRKADARFCIPLCAQHHREHHEGERTFAETHRIDLLATAEAVEARWQDALAHWKP